MKKILVIYSNKKGFVFNNKYHFGCGGKLKAFKINNIDIFLINFLSIHFFYLKKTFN